MVKGARQILDIVTEFCREHLEMLMIAGAVLVGLIVLIAIIKAITGKDSDDDFELDFDENELFEYKPQKDAERPEADMTAPPEEAEASAPEPEEKEQIAADRIENILEEISNISAQNLQEVEIKLHGAEVKFKYAKDSSGDCKFSRKAAPQVEIEPSAGDELAAEGDIENTDPQPAEPPETLPTEPVPEYVKTAEAVKKFGPDNINTTRSGQVFTEEKLKEQIRD